MKKSEFLTYFDMCQGKETSATIDGPDMDAISKVRNHAFISIARVGQVFAAMKDNIDKKFLVFRGGGMALDESKKRAEESVNEEHEVSRRELEWLLKALDQCCNSCASRINVLQNERKGS